MAYWRNYCKFEAEASALAAAFSSDENNILDDTPIATCHTNSPNDSASPNILHNILDYTDPDDLSGDISDSDDVHQTTHDSDEHIVNIPPLSCQLASWATKNTIRREAVNELLEILRLHGSNLPKDARTLLDTPREVSVVEKCGGQYSYCGIKAGIIQELAKYPDFGDKHDHIDLIINIDGLPLFKSSNSQFWPILGCFNNLDVFVIALFHGCSKPHPLSDYLEDFLAELDKIQVDGITHGGKRYAFKICCFSCDAPARCFLKCIIGHTGYFACERCVMKGSWEGRVVYNVGEASELRTDDKFANCDYEHHQKCVSPLIGHNISCVQGFPLDYMHMVCLGVVKRILHFLKSGPRICKLSSGQIAQISAKLVLLKGKMPREFARQPRSLIELERWKATEFRQFLLYTGPIVLRNVVADKTYQHFLALSIAMSIMLDANTPRRNAYLAYAQQLLQHFVNNCKHVYGETFAVYNVHGLLHLHEDINFYGCSLNEISCFPFENFMQRLKKLVRNGNNPVAQVGKRLVELNCGNVQKSYIKPQFTHVSSNWKDGCFLLANNRFVFVKETRDNGELVCDVVPEQRTEPFITTPADSKLFNIVYVQNIEKWAKRRLIVKTDLVCKAVCLPFREGYVLFPLHHEIEKQ